MRFGLEKEFWCVSSGVVVGVPSGLPMDECGYLAEARGEPCSSIEQAVFSLKAEIYRVEKIADSLGVQLDDSPSRNLSRSFLLKMSRKFEKGLVRFENYLGHENHKLAYHKGERGAGVHVTFSHPVAITNPAGGIETVYRNFDWMKIFRRLDSEFSKEIKEAKRLPGFYEVKINGLIEYRSLPSNVDLMKVIDVIKRDE